MTDEFSYLQAIRKYHDLIDQRIRLLKAKIYKKEGWIFVTHTYKKEDLLQDHELAMVDAMIENISALVNEWATSNGGFSMLFYSEYISSRDTIRKSLHELQDEIRYRQPTSWEKLKEGFTGLIAYLVSKLPDVILNALGLPNIVNLKRLKNE